MVLCSTVIAEGKEEEGGRFMVMRFVSQVTTMYSEAMEVAGYLPANGKQ